jgi:endonuclease G
MSEKPLSFKKLFAIMKKNRKRFSSFRGVHNIDVGFKYRNGLITDELCFRFHVNRKLNKDILGDEGIPSELEGVKTDVIISNPVLQSRSGVPYNPIIGGIEIQNIHSFDSGTLATIMYDKNNQLVGLSNYHILFASSGQIGDQIIQPANNLNPNLSSAIGQLVNGDTSLDCAIFSFSNNLTANVGEIAGLNNLITKTKDPEPGDLVKKSGTTTEITYGSIDGVAINGYVTISANPTKPNINGIISYSGDSGALWILDNGTDDTAVALHKAGLPPNWNTAYGYSINLVNKSLSISFNQTIS